MAHLNITLDQEEIPALLSVDHDGAFRKLLQECLNKVLLAECTEQLGAEPYERSEKRKDSRNGTRERSLTLRVGTIDFTVPRHRNIPFKTILFENYARSEATLVAGMAEMVVNGVSTRKVEKIMEELCGTSFSKSTVSNVCKDLSKDVEAFRNRPINGPYPFLTVDATYFKVRENHRIVSKAFFIAYGTNSQRNREILGFNIYPQESTSNWRDFLDSLKKHGLYGTLLVTSDAHGGLKAALQKEFPEAPWQRCQFHFTKNISELAPKKYQAGIRAELNELFQSKTMKEAIEKRDEILRSYGEVASRAMECLEEGFEDAMTVMILPKGMRRFFRTSNHVERFNRELKRRSNVIGVFPNEASLMRLMGSILMELNEKRQAGKAIFSKQSYEKMIASDTPAELKRAAIRQFNMAVA